MRVLMILPVKIGFDGMTKQILSLRKYMDKTNIEMDLLSCRGYDFEMRKTVEEAGFDNVYRYEYRDSNQVRYFFELTKLIRKRKYDIVHANGQSATLAIEMLAAKIGGCKVRIAHSHNSNCQHKRVHKLLLPLFNATYNDAIACSREAGDWLFQDKNYWILRNGVDVAQFQFNMVTRRKVRQELNLADKDVAVGNVAAFEPKKNHVFLIDILEKLIMDNPYYKLFLWGIDGSSKEVIMQEIARRRLQNNIIYRATTNHIWDYLQAMDIMLLPSWYEGFPVTVVEWQAAGLPCIVSDTITKDVNINGLVKFLPIDQGEEPWIDTIKEYGSANMKRESNIWQQRVKDRNYDIQSNADELKEHYIMMLNRLSRGGVISKKITYFSRIDVRRTA